MPTANAWQIEVRDEVGVTRRVALAGEAVTLGRAADADLQLDRPTVSRKHARLTPDADHADGSWTLEDLGSRGGTFLNGQRVEQPTPVRPDDLFTISRFTLRLIAPPEAHAPPEDAPPDEGDAARPSGSAVGRGSSSQAHAPRPEDDDPQLSVLTHVAPPSLDASHITELYEFGRQMIALDEAEARLARLCEVMTGPVIRGRWVMALAMDADDPSRPPQRLAAHPPDAFEDKEVHISRTTIRAMQRANAPVLASNFKEGEGVVEMSIVAQAPAAAAVACPLSEDDGGRTLLYVNLPPMFGSTQWLALIALAVRQYQQAEAAAAARQAVRAAAAVERELANARTIQTSLLPNLQTLDVIDARFSFQPCDSVGGDLVDLLPLPDGRSLAVIADVTGHGLPAALTTLAVHSIIHTTLRNAADLPGMMRTLNEHLCDYLPDGRFVTMIALAIDTRTGAIEMLNAGHPAPIVFAPDGAPTALPPAPVFPLGIDRVTFTAQHATLEPGHTLLMMTDGLPEMHTQPDGAMLGPDGVTELLQPLFAQAPGASLDALINQTRASLDDLRGAQPQLDDETFLLLRR